MRVLYGVALMFVLMLGVMWAMGDVFVGDSREDISAGGLFR